MYPTRCDIPEITVYVRHAIDCRYHSDQYSRKCQCRKHLRWSVCGSRHRQAANTRSWNVAEQRKRELEAKFEAVGSKAESVTVEKPQPAQTIDRTLQLFLSSKTSQGISPSVVKKYGRELERFVSFMAKRSKHFPSEITLEDLTEFRAGWMTQYPSSTTRSKVQERLRSLLRYMYDAGLIERIPRLSPIKVDQAPTMPLTPDEHARLLTTIPKVFPSHKAQRVQALVQLMRYSGLAIRDAVTLKREELQQEATLGTYRVTTSRQKTGTHVSVLLPPAIATEVIAAMKLNVNEHYVFWNTGTGKPQSAVANWQHDLREVFRAAGMVDGHPHQLRDTFAVSLLEKGVPLGEVSKLLGHESVKTTEKYYAKWVKERQDRLDTLVAATW